jgi:amino acid adenylation domain-containing protein
MDLSGNAVSIRAALDAIAELQPEVTFLISSESGSSITFRELQSHSLILSRILMHAGLQPGDKVAFLMDNGLLTAELFLGTMYGGFVAVPLNVRAGVVQLSYMLGHCDAKLVFVQDEYKELLTEALADIRKDVQIIEATVGGRLSDLAEGIDLEAPASPAPVPTVNDIALLMYSSGSSGKPKGALHTHSSILAHGRNSITSHQLSATDRSLLVLPLYHINAECVTLIPTLLSGGSVVIAHRFAVNCFWDWIDDFEVTWSALVTTIISELVDWDGPEKERQQAAFQRIRFFRFSSAFSPSSLQQQFIDKFDLPLIQAMGSTEAGNVFSNPVPPGKNKFGSSGLAWGFETRIIDREGNDVPRGEPGEVLLRGPALMKCYYKDPEGTAAVIDNEGWLHTGDLAHQDEDGYYFVVESDQTSAESQSWEESFLKQYVPSAQKSIPRLNSTLPHPLSPLQQRLWFMEKLNPDVPVYNESEAVLLTGNLNIAALEKAFNVIIGRHEALRSTIEVIDGAPNAIIHQDWPLHFREFDLSHLTPAKRQSELDRLLIDEPRIPYSLETAPGIRISLICLSEREHVLILNMHHIICDWASEGIIWRELSAAYHSFLKGEPANLPALPISHRDYAVWNENRLNEVDFSQDLAFWEENLKDVPTLLEIPTDRPRPATMSHKGKRQRRKLNSNLTEALRTSSRQERTSLLTIFAAALDIVLYRYTGTDDILLGLPIGDRDLPELQSTIGFLLHTHVLRTALSSDITFRELLSRVQKGVLDLYAHRAVPFDQVVRKLQPERNPSHSPLFQVVLNWRDRDQQLDFIGLEGLAVESLMASADTCKFDLFFFVTDTGNEIWLELEYNTDLFDHDRISRLLGHYQTVLEAVVADPCTTVGEIPLLTTDEYKQVVFDWNHTQADFPEEQCVDQLIEKQIGRVPDKIAVSCGEERLTYRQLGDRINQLAGYLQQSGVKRNDLVAICVERSVDMIIGLLGIMRAGAAYLPLDPTFPPERLAFMLQDAQPLILLTQERLRALLPKSEALVVALDALPSSTGIPPATAAKHEPDDLAYVLYTSGSTGTPKGVQIPHRALANFILSMQREPGITANDTLLAITTLSFDIAGLELYLPLTVGAHLVIASNEAARDGKQLLALMKSAETTIMQATPVTWRMLLDAGWHGDQNLIVLCGGESWSSELAMQLLSRCKSLWNMYGPTETTIWSAVSRVQAKGHVLIGQPIANTSLYILDHCNQPAAVGIPGELHIGGRGLALGYLGLPELTGQRFIPHPFSAHDEKLYKTGDLVRRLADGSIEFLRRLDHQIKLRGFRIELGEIESMVERQPGIKQCVVTLQEFDQDDRRLAAYIVQDNQHKAPAIDELRNTLKQQLPAYMVPSTFSVLNSMPLTANGKIDRKVLSVSTVTARSGSAAVASPRDAIESTLVQIWEKLLQVHPVGIRSNFFDLGGYSMLVFRLFAEVNKTYHSSLPIATIFTARTIEQLAEVIRGRAFEQATIQPGSRNSVEHSAIVPIQSYGSSAPLFIVHGVQGHIVGFQQIATLLGSDQPVYGVQAQTNISGEAGLLRLEDQAAYYVSNIRSIQPQGPYRLLGYCFGGLVALEIAQQLHALGQEVELLGLLDSHNRDYIILEAHQDGSTAIRFGDHIERFLTSFRRLSLFKQIIFIPEKLIIRVKRWSYKSAHRIGFRSVPSFMKSTEEILKVAADQYRPKPWHGRLTLFRTALQPDARLPWDLGWAPLAKEGVEVCDLPGDHWTIFREPNIFVLAKQLREHLESPHAEPELSRDLTEQLQSVAD